jgi:hypothetical protein
MPNHWRPTRGRTAPRVDQGTSTAQVEPSRRHHQTPQHVEPTANPALGSQDVEKLPRKRSVSRTRTDPDRPRTAGGATQPTSTVVERPPRGSSRAYTAEAQRPPVQRLDLKTTYCMDEEMIGMALGSPGHPRFVQTNVHDHLYAAPGETGAQAHPEGIAEGKSTNVKAGKWKKFGGLFKPKHNLSIPAATAVPQSSQPQHPEQNLDATESKPIPLPKDTPKISQTLRHPEPAPAPADNPPTQDVKNNNVTILRTQLPKLDVDIPDIQMDRYSVMFGSLLGGQQSASLLSRRSKVLERLKTTDETVASEDPLPQPKQLDNAGLSTHVAESEYSEQLIPPPSSRRATSPTPGKSPVFSLFPQTPATPRRAAATTSQAKPTPLQRSFTAPSRLSPMEETFGTKKPQPVKPNYTKRRKSSISLVETSASTTQGPGWSTDDSYLSPTSSVSSVSDEILFDIKKLSMVTENQEPQYEVTKPDGETVELYRARSQKNRAAKPPALKLLSKYSTAEASKSSAPEANESISSSSDATVRSTNEGANTVPAISKSSDPEYLLPSTHFVPTTHTVEAANEPCARESNQIKAQTFRLPAGVKGRSIPEANPPMEPVWDSPIEIEESAEASHDILAAAVMGTLDHMGEQSSLRAASPMPPDSPGFRVPTPEKAIKLLAIPKNIPISKYSLRPSADSHAKTDQISRSSSPQPRRAVTEPLVHDQSFAAHETRLQAAPAIPTPPVKKTTPRSNSSLKIVPAQGKSNSKIRGPKPVLSIVAPQPADTIDTPHSALSPIEVTVARQVSLSRKQSKRLLIAPAARRLEGLSEDNGEKVVNTQALMPVIVDAHKAHRPGKSLAVSIQNA